MVKKLSYILTVQLPDMIACILKCKLKIKNFCALVQRTLLGVWNTTLNLWDSVIRKRINLQQLKLELKLISVMNDQVI